MKKGWFETIRLFLSWLRVENRYVRFLSDTKFYLSILFFISKYYDLSQNTIFYLKILFFDTTSHSCLSSFLKILFRKKLSNGCCNFQNNLVKMEKRICPKNLFVGIFKSSSVQISKRWKPSLKHWSHSVNKSERKKCLILAPLQTEFWIGNEFSLKFKIWQRRTEALRIWW